MLSTFRRALGQTLRFPHRQLSAVTSIASSPASPLAQDATTLPSEVPSGVITEASTSTTYSSPFAKPLYMTMSSLIRPVEGAPPPSDNVVELDPSVFNHDIRRDILHLCVVHYLDSLRQGTASTKTRGEVRGSGRKIRPQKGTGRARLGDGQSPMLRGGGIAFGPKPRDFSTKLNRKVTQMGMRVALSARVKERCLGVVESLQWPSAKTKDLSERIEELGWRKTLFVTGEKVVPDGLERACGNLYKMETITAEELKVYHVVKWPRVVLDLAAVEYFERTLAKPIVHAKMVYT